MALYITSNENTFDLKFKWLPNLKLLILEQTGLYNFTIYVFNDVVC